MDESFVLFDLDDLLHYDINVLNKLRYEPKILFDCVGFLNLVLVVILVVLTSNAILILRINFVFTQKNIIP